MFKMCKNNNYELINFVLLKVNKLCVNNFGHFDIFFERHLKDKDLKSLELIRTGLKNHPSIIHYYLYRTYDNETFIFLFDFVEYNWFTKSEIEELFKYMCIHGTMNIITYIKKKFPYLDKTIM